MERQRHRSIWTPRGLAMVATLALATISAIPVARGADTTSVPGTSSGKLVTSPARQLASIMPGGRSTFPMIVQNRLGRTATIEVTTHDLAPGNDSYSELSSAGSESRGAGTWLTPEAGTFVLRDGERRTFDVAIAVPTTAGPGGHYAAVAVGIGPDQDDDRRLGVGVRIATNVTVLVPGGVSFDGAVRDVGLAAAGDDRVRVEFDARITGNIQSKPRAAIRVTGPFGTSVTRRVDLPEILPGGMRHISKTLPRPALAGPMRATVSLRFEDRSTSKRVHSRDAWILPPRPVMAAAVAALVLAALLAEVARRWRLRRLLERYGDEADLDAGETDDDVHWPDDRDLTED